MTLTHNAPTTYTAPQTQKPLRTSRRMENQEVRPRAQRANYQLVTAPACARCKTDSYIYIEEYIPPQINDDGELTKLGEASYFCTRCVEYAAHAVPPLWTPEGHQTA